MSIPNIHHFYHSPTFTFSYVVSDPVTKQCAVIDSVLDYNQGAARTSTGFADEIIEYISEHGLSLQWILETHAHADHLTASHYLKEKLGGQIGIGARITEVQEIFKGLYNLEDSFQTDGSQFDRLFSDGDVFSIGELSCQIMETPGHTPACITFLINKQHAFIGDTLFMPDYGTARCDFPGGSAGTMYDSIQKIYALGDDIQLYMCHDYRPDAPAPRWLTTVKQEKAHNPLIQEGVTKQMYAKARDTIDKVLSAPKLILPSLQVNI
ncbi:MAG TPA: MBL fold metallo-hydrolase, partial [Crenotrichaceae bacterium]|nr:MBL fold metallo-hydrolase [Crenotrichaceae bacterium]